MKRVFAPALLLTTSLMLTPVGAQESALEPVVEAATSINQSARQSQLTVEAIADTTQERIQQYKQITRQIDGLRVYTEQLQRQLSSQATEQAELSASIDEVSVVERQITPLMLRMIAALETFVDLDVPFQPTERSDRVATLNELMDRADVDVSEKFRRVMEAYQIEADYGRNIEAYNGAMDIEGKSQNVEFLRIGRTILLYKSRDGQHLGVWNQTERNWQELDQSYGHSVQEALRIARKQLAPDLLMLPVPIAGE